MSSSQMNGYLRNPELQNEMLPVDIVLAPDWWYRHEKISFDEDFFYHPARRVEDEMRMEKALYERWGRFIHLFNNHRIVSSGSNRYMRALSLSGICAVTPSVDSCNPVNDSNFMLVLCSTVMVYVVLGSSPRG